MPVRRVGRYRSISHIAHPQQIKHPVAHVTRITLGAEQIGNQQLAFCRVIDLNKIQCLLGSRNSTHCHQKRPSHESRIIRYCRHLQVLVAVKRRNLLVHPKRGFLQHRKFTRRGCFSARRQYRDKHRVKRNQTQGNHEFEIQTVHPSSHTHGVNPSRRPKALQSARESAHPPAPIQARATLQSHTNQPAHGSSPRSLHRGPHKHAA